MKKQSGHRGQAELKDQQVGLHMIDVGGDMQGGARIRPVALEAGSE
jgi:hypothetical protein